ncbi:hypothetical protein CHLRE_17g708013v5 [Chlamydomonas reinhardtii]|uniref:Uncharacterized protein n=1 Tax=Chlamydomonas reinhardtii TaxID=3055 RepID=A0A2K3CPG6_CHLRE|nr:uncharacterized protein CHLRE_17g708013v5 [Chlamydomonas reinhardtii]PNW70153.1 hypothetical protein CHLRE_17g708013v5 [Chlamydomonas reinhardtii]
MVTGSNVTTAEPGPPPRELTWQNSRPTSHGARVNALRSSWFSGKAISARTRADAS